MVEDKNRLRKTYSFYRQQPVYASGGGGGGTTGGGDPDASYLVLSLTSSLSNERRFIPSIGLKATDGGANSNYTLSINDGEVATISGSTFTGVTKHTLGLSGSLTTLVDGTSYLIAGNNISIFSSSNGSVTISSTAATNNFFSSTTNGSIFTTGSAAFIGNEAGIDSPSDKGTNVFFYISGSISGSGVDDKRSLFGGDVVISGSLRQGLLVNASGLYSHAEGQTTTASGAAAHAEGSSTTASASGAHAEGANTTASGIYSHAEGLTTTASAIASHAEGQFTIASGWYSHAEGASTTASGIASHAEGSSTEAVGTYSLAAGIGTIASGSGQNVFGQYNLRNNSTSLFIIGDGTSTSNATRGDIVRVNKGISIGRGIVEVTGSFAATLGLSGSLTRLTDGTSYLVAGTNVTISSASNGQVTISSTGGGTPAGSNTELQFNNAGSFGASANLNFNSSTNLLSLTGSFGMKGNIIPDEDTTYTLGTSEKRWGHVYTGDLHLRNDRGDWTIVEERDYLCVINNITGKKYKMMLQPIDSES
jgi:hypothetical protein